jgi:hypothetical protein
MTPERADELLAGILDGAPTESDHRELLEAALQDPALGRRLTDLLRIQPFLVEALAGDEAEEGFLRRIRHGLNDQSDTAFIRAIVQKASIPVRPPEGSKKARTWHTLRRHSSDKNSSWAVLAVAAAGVLAAVTLFFVLGPPEGDPAPSQRAKEARVRASRDAEVRRQAEQERTERERALAEAQARRVEAEAHLREIVEKRSILTQAKSEPQENPLAKEKRVMELEVLRRDQDRIEQELKDAIELARKAERPGPAGPSQEDKPLSPPVAPGIQSQGTTQATLAQVEEAAGGAFRVTKEGKSPLVSGANVFLSEGLQTGGGTSHIVLRFPDKSRVDLGPDTLLAEITIDSGKRLALTQGTARAVVAKQPKAEPMIFATPHGEAKVLGTTLRLYVDPDPKKGTRLEVEEGKVELKNLTGKAVNVESRHYAVAAAGMELAAKSLDSSMNVPRQGMALWFRSDQGVALNGTTVSGWADLSGNKRHAVQPVRAQQPTFVRNAIQEHPALRFDGVDDCLSFPCPVTGLSGMTLFLVAATVEELTAGNPGAGNAAIYWNQMDMNFGGVVLTPYSAKVNFYFGTGQPQPILSYSRPASLARGYSLSTTIKNGSDAVLFVNGQECLRVGGQNPPLSKCEEIGQIGRGEGDQQTNRKFPGQREGWTYFSGEIAEVIVYTCALAESERRSVEQYLLSKYLLK